MQILLLLLLLLFIIVTSSLPIASRLKTYGII